jgi:DNA polymerase-4
MGVRSIGELAAQPLELLSETFGPAHGQFLFEAAHGSDERPLVTHWEPKSRSRETTFQRDTDDWQTVARTLAGLCREVAEELAQERCRGRVVGIKLRFADFETHTREKTLDAPTDAADTIRKAAFECLGRLALDKKVRLIGVRVGGLEKCT